MSIRELTSQELDEIGGGVDSYAASAGVAVGFLALGLTVSSPVWAPPVLISSSIVASSVAIAEALDS